MGFDRGMAEEIVTRDEIRAMRRSYSDAGLESLPENPFEAFASWLKDAHENPVIVEANAMVLSTVTADSQINTRTVLLKDISDGGFTFFTQRMQRDLGFTETHANTLEIHDGKLTGAVLGDIVDATTKAQVVAELATQYGITATQTVAIGDGANDIPMLNAAALGVAFHAKPKVQAQAKAAIRKGSLLQLLYLLD